jgi:hypothetical protein
MTYRQLSGDKATAVPSGPAASAYKLLKNVGYHIKLQPREQFDHQVWSEFHVTFELLKGKYPTFEQLIDEAVIHAGTFLEHDPAAPRVAAPVPGPVAPGDLARGPDTGRTPAAPSRSDNAHLAKLGLATTLLVILLVFGAPALLSWLTAR